MSITLPFLNFTPHLYKEVLQADVLFSEYSILRLMCLKEQPVSVAQQVALENFEGWLIKFIRNSNLAFNSGADVEVSLFRIDYSNLLLSCLLVATFYDYRAFSVAASLNNNSFIFWQDGHLVKERPMSQLL